MYCVGCSVQWGTKITKDLFPHGTERPHGTYDIPMCIMISPTVLKITPHGTQDIPHIYHDIRHGTEHPPRY